MLFLHDHFLLSNRRTLHLVANLTVVSSYGASSFAWKHELTPHRHVGINTPYLGASLLVGGGGGLFEQIVLVWRWCARSRRPYLRLLPVPGCSQCRRKRFANDAFRRWLREIQRKDQNAFRGWETDHLGKCEILGLVYVQCHWSEDYTYGRWN